MRVSWEPQSHVRLGDLLRLPYLPSSPLMRRLPRGMESDTHPFGAHGGPRFLWC